MSCAARPGQDFQVLEARNFSDLLDRFRERMAVDLLQRQDLAIYEVAFLLGYSEPSTFFRAFRRWTGMSPLKYRGASES